MLTGLYNTIDNCSIWINFQFLVLFLHFLQKNKTYKIGLGVCVSVCLCVCTILVPPNNFQTSYPIDTKFWLHIVSYRNSPMPLIPLLNFENCAWEKFLKFIFSPFNVGKFQIHITPLIYDLDD